MVEAGKEFVFCLERQHLVGGRIGEEDTAVDVEEQDVARGCVQRAVQELCLDHQASVIESAGQGVGKDFDAVVRLLRRLAESEGGFEIGSRLERYVGCRPGGLSGEIKLVRRRSFFTGIWNVTKLHAAVWRRAESKATDWMRYLNESAAICVSDWQNS